MKQKREIYQEAYQIINQRHSQAVQEGERRRRELMESLPEAVDLQDRIAKTAIAYTRLVLSHDATLEEMLPSLQQENLRLQQQMGRVLTLAGYPENYLDIPYTCPFCRDTGFDETGERCACYQKLVRDITAQEFNKNSPMGARRFEDFRLDFYPEGVRESMGKVLTFCRRYSQDFSLSSPSLLMMGATGLGKSHLSLAIAAEVVQKGYMVLNGSVQDLFSAVQNEYYGRGQSDISTMDSMRQADLLVLDDLGSEYDTPFQNSTLFSILNYRLEQQKPTIISTNLTFQQIERRYSDRVASRLLTLYTCLKFTGVDVRQEKLRRNAGR